MEDERTPVRFERIENRRHSHQLDRNARIQGEIIDCVKRRLPPGTLGLVLSVCCCASTVMADTVLVVNKSAHELAFVDTSLVVEARVPVGQHPHEIVVDESRDYAYVTNFGTNADFGFSISVVDLRTRTEVKRIDTFPYGKPHGITRIGKHIYFTTGRPSAVGRYDTDSEKIDWIVETGETNSHMVVVKSDPLKIYVANVASGTVTVLSFEPFSDLPVINKIVIGIRPEGMVLSSDERTLWIGHLGEGRISILDTSTDSVIESFDLGVGPIRLVFTPDGERLLVTDYEKGTLEIVDVASRLPLQSIEVGLRPVGLMLSPDAGEAWVAVTGDDEIAIVDLETYAVTHRFSPGSEPDGMAWLEPSRRRAVRRVVRQGDVSAP